MHLQAGGWGGGREGRCGCVCGAGVGDMLWVRSVWMPGVGGWEANIWWEWVDCLDDVCYYIWALGRDIKKASREECLAVHCLSESVVDD